MKTRALGLGTAALAATLMWISSEAAAQTSTSFPADHMPDGAHPRLWLTAERLQTLKAAQEAKTPEWERFNAQIDSFMNEEGWAQWLGHVGGIPSLALMYVLTHDGRYAERVLYLAQHADTSYSSAERYWIRSNGMLALGYDWVYDYMNEEQKAAYQNVMLTYADNMWADAHWHGTDLTYTAIDTDRVTEGSSQYLMMGAAMYGDSPRATELLDRAWGMWVRGNGSDSYSSQSQKPTPIRTWIRDAIGGTYYTGLAYYMHTDTAGLSRWFTSLRTAFHYDIRELEPELSPIWRGMIRSTIDLTDPPRKRFLAHGDWQDDNTIDSQKWVNSYMATLIFEAEQAGDADWAALGRGYYKQIPESWHTEPFTEFFFSDPSKPAVDPYTANLPPVRTCKGIDFMYFRSSWDTKATWGHFSGQGGEPTDHQSEDTGTFTLFREDDYLTKTATGYRDFLDASYVHNTMAIDNGRPNGSTRIQDHEGKAGLDRHRENNQEPLFAYAMMQGDKQWNLAPEQYAEDPDKMRPVNSYRRHFFWSGDYVVVLDRLRTKRDVETKYRLRALTEPTREGLTISQLSENGHQKLLHRTLEPEDVSFNLLDETQAWSGLQEYQVHTPERHWQHEIKAPSTSHLNLLNVMQMGPSSMNDFDPLEHVTGSDFTGVRLGTWVTVFASEEQLLSKVIYNIASPVPGMHHLVADLQPGLYDAWVGTEKVADGLTVQDGDNTAFFTTNSETGPMQVTVSRAGDLPPPPPDAGVDGQAPGEGGAAGASGDGGSSQPDGGDVVTFKADDADGCSCRTAPTGGAKTSGTLLAAGVALLGLLRLRRKPN